MIDHRGDVPDEELAEARRAGLTDADLTATLAVAIVTGLATTIL